jgi:N-hydroxyarylamine O-acetyltransferase
MPKESFPVEAYLNRVGFSRTALPDEKTLISLHRAQVFSLPFENLDPWTGTPVRIDYKSLLQKMVFNRNEGRGGYCFELNQLFLLALRALGFKTRSLCARVWRNDSYGPRSHQITLVSIGRKHWLADVGFGGNGLIEAIPFEPGREADQILDRYRLQKDEDYGYRLETRVHDEWRKLYAFSLDPFTSADFYAMSYFVSTCPASLFTQIPMCMLPTENERRILYGNILKIRGAKKKQQQAIETSAALRGILKDNFDLHWPENRPLPDPVPAPPDARPIE